MISKEHKKHSDITRPSYGYYCRNEWAIVGTQCSAIKSLADDIIKALSPQYKCAYAGNTTMLLATAERCETFFPLISTIVANPCSFK